MFIDDIYTVNNEDGRNLGDSHLVCIAFDERAMLERGSTKLTDDLIRNSALNLADTTLKPDLSSYSSGAFITVYDEAHELIGGYYETFTCFGLDEVAKKTYEAELITQVNNTQYTFKFLVEKA